MTFPLVDGMRAMELGTPGEMRARLNGYVIHGAKRATAGQVAEYEREGEPIEHVGERLALVDDQGARVATLEVTRVEVRRFADVPWEFAAAEAEGDRDIEEWRAGHHGFWERVGEPVDDDSPIVLVWFDLVEVAGDDGGQPGLR